MPPHFHSAQANKYGKILTTSAKFGGDCTKIDSGLALSVYSSLFLILHKIAWMRCLFNKTELKVVYVSTTVLADQGRKKITNFCTSYLLWSRYRKAQTGTQIWEGDLVSWKNADASQLAQILLLPSSFTN